MYNYIRIIILYIYLKIHQILISHPPLSARYWGLDYPPLTAFHSWLLGMLDLQKPLIQNVE